MIAAAALTDDLQFDEISDATLDTRNTRPDLGGDVLVGWKAKALLIGVFSQAVVYGNADGLDFASILIEQNFAYPIPINISKILYFYFFIRHINEK